MTVERGQHIPEVINPQGFKNVPDIAAWACQQYADKPAFTSLGRTLRFQELDELADAFAVYLQSYTDLKPGDRIAIQLPNIVQYPVVLLGAMRAGLVVVNTNPLYTASEMRHQFCDSGAKALVIHKSMACNAEQILDDTEIETVFVTQVGDLHSFLKRVLINAVVKYVKKMEPPFNLPEAIQLFDALDQCMGQIPAPVEINSDDIAVLQYTGGTTGLSKGGVLTRASLVSGVLQGSERINAVGGGWQHTVIAPLPLYHIYAFTLAQIVLLAGGHSVLIPNPRDMPGFIKELGNWKTSTFLGLNTLFVGLCNQPAFADVDFSHLRMTVSGGMALTHAAAEQWEQATGCNIMEGYGLTETSPVVSVNPYGGVQVGTIGLPLLETEVKVVDAEGVTLPAEQPGELCVRGPQVMKGYWNNPSATENSLRKGWLWTGDIGSFDADGFLTLKDRSKDMIISGGSNIYPREVEEVLLIHSDVDEVSVVGDAHAEWGEIVVAFVKLHENSKQKDNMAQKLDAHCLDHIARFKRPKQYYFLDALPKNNYGKVLKTELRTLLQTKRAPR